MNYKVVFNYETEDNMLHIPSLKNVIESEYVKLRNIACDRLNDCYEKWNNEFDGPAIEADDELAYCGGTAYCNYIRSKQQPILDEVNEHHSRLVKLYSTKECDIGGIIVMTGTKFFITLKEA